MLKIINILCLIDSKINAEIIEFSILKFYKTPGISVIFFQNKAAILQFLNSLISFNKLKNKC